MSKHLRTQRASKNAVRVARYTPLIGLTVWTLHAKGGLSYATILLSAVKFVAFCGLFCVFVLLITCLYFVAITVINRVDDWIRRGEPSASDVEV